MSILHFEFSPDAHVIEQCYYADLHKHIFYYWHSEAQAIDQFTVAIWRIKIKEKV